jgi:hypothetical protein
MAVKVRAFLRNALVDSPAVYSSALPNSHGLRGKLKAEE